MQQSSNHAFRGCFWPALIVILTTFLCMPPPSLGAGADLRIVKVGLYENAPKIFTDASGRPSGIFVDVITSIAQTEGWQLKYVGGTWREGLERLEKGDIDLMPDVAYSAERDKLFDYHQVPVLSSWFQVYSRQGSGIHSILDLGGKRVAVLDRSIQQEAFRQLAVDFQLDITLVSLPDYQTMFERVAKNEVHAAITNRFYGLTHAKMYDLADTAVIFHPSNLFFAAPANASRSLLDAIDDNLLTLKKDPRSAYYRSLKRWISEDVPFQLPSWVQTLGLMAGVVLFTSLVASVILKRQVTRRTRKLHHMNRALQTFSECNQALARCEAENELLDAVCRILLSVGGYRLAWVGLIDAKNTESVHHPRIVAHAGLADAIGDAGGGDNPIAAPIGGLIQNAVETGKPCSAQFRSTHPDLAFLQASGSRPTHVSVLVLPLISDAQWLGILCIYSLEPKAFNAKEMAQLTELASDLSFGMASHRMRDALKEAEEKQREAQQRFADIVEFLPDATFVLDHDRTIIAWNHACEIMTGVAKDRLLGQDNYAHAVPFFGKRQPILIDLLDLPMPEVEATYKYVTRKGDKIYAESYIPSFNNGQGAHLWGVASPLYDQHGRRCGAIEIVRDITARIEAEKQVRRLNDDLQKHAQALEQRVAERTAELVIAKERAESADRIKSAFLATMSHELRTPLNSIIGFTGILLQELAGPLNPEQKKQLGMVQASSRHLLSLINDVLDISKIEAGQLELSTSPFELGQSIEKMVKIASPLAEKKGIDLILDMPEESYPLVSDQRRVEQIILNLLNNALKFTEHGHVRVFCRSENGCYSVSVEDTGIGIQADDISGLFQPFHQIDTGLSRKHEGTGLGLSICKKLLDMMGGAIDVQSKWGQGSTFTIRIPRQTQAGVGP